MLSIDEALARCLADVADVSPESVNIELAYGRVLAEDVVAASPLPPWDNSAMDGFAVRASDTDGAAERPAVDACAAEPAQSTTGPWLNVVGTVAAGQVSQQSLQPGEAIRIMTGAPMPEGADAVVMREYATVDDSGKVQIHQEAEHGQHIRRCGEDVAAGTVVLHAGETLRPASVGLCASVGRQQVQVASQPRVGNISTGDEIVAPGKALGPGQIYSSNTHALAGLVAEAGAIAVDCGIAPDNLEATRAAFRSAMNCDLILSTGGVSVGDFDVVREAMVQEGAEMQFWKVRMKPGKPLAMGIIGGVPAFGLPGNPVSCQVGFLQFVRPWIRMALGDPNPYLPVVHATLDGDLRKRPGRAEFVRVTIHWTDAGLVARSTGSQGSGQQTSMAAAHGLVILSEEADGARHGQNVSVQVIGDAFPPCDSPRYPW